MSEVADKLNIPFSKDLDDLLYSAECNIKTARILLNHKNVYGFLAATQIEDAYQKLQEAVDQYCVIDGRSMEDKLP